MRHLRLTAVPIRPARGERGASATEYGLLVGFIAIAIVAGVATFGTALNGAFEALATWLGDVI